MNVEPPHDVKLEPLADSPLAGCSSRQPRVAPWLLHTVGWVCLAAAALDAAYLTAGAGFLVLVYLFALLQLAQAPTWRKAFYPGLIVGLLLAFTRLEFFWRLFSGGAVALWLVFAFWIGLFVALARLLLRSTGPGKGAWNLAWCLVPFIWCGLEYFRSELYYLRFAWLSPGFAFGGTPGYVPLHPLGTYGVGFLAMCVACGAACFWPGSKVKALAVLAVGAAGLRFLGLLGEITPTSSPSKVIRVAGVQLEFPTQKEVLQRLTELVQRHHEADLLVLSEYTFTEPVPEPVLKWCRQYRRYLVVGGKDPLPGGKFYNTAFVISPEGQIVLRQVKRVPIQFFNDGLPAPEQNVWNSPWGKIGICVCYDLSYRWVTDPLVKLGAEALLVPTMDVVDWGKPQHTLHAQVAPLRAAEYGLPIFRLASSGISQLVNQQGRVLASAPFGGAGAMIAGALELRGPGRLPLDRWLAPLAVAVTAAVVHFAFIQFIVAKFPRRRIPAAPPP